MMAVQVATQPSLFPEPLAREARFLDDCRIELSRSWGSGGRRALVIGHNPSMAAATREDPTSLWWNRWFAHYGFDGYSAANLYPFVAPDPDDCYRRVTDPSPEDLDMILRNLDELVEMAARAAQVFVCWGNLARDQTWVLSVIGALEHHQLWCWGTTKAGNPTHPMARGKHRLDPLALPMPWTFPTA